MNLGDQGWRELFSSEAILYVCLNAPVLTVRGVCVETLTVHPQPNTATGFREGEKKKEERAKDHFQTYGLWLREYRL